MDNPGRWFIYLLTITTSNLIKVACRYLNDFEPACGGVDHCLAGETNIITNDSLARLMLSCILTIWIYQVHMQ